MLGNVSLNVFGRRWILVGRHVALAVVSQMFVYDVDVLLVNMEIAELAVHRLIRDEAEHLTVTDVRF